ncbi:MAG: FAD-dependent oxidoreductase [Bdellovibrionales bacterium]|nr:FAD-dependent oxidoreductase [Bdellovibrionales bacterium]
MKRIIGKINPEQRHVTIWGAGFSGLILGYFLKDQGYNVTIHEKSNKVGGKIQTKRTGAGMAEKGPNALYLNQDGLELLKELKLEPIPATKKLRRLLMINGKPKSPFQLALFSKIATNIHKKPPLVSDGLTVADFFQPLLGQENVEHYLSPVLGGLYATPADQLHFKSIFPQVGKKAQFNSYWAFIKMLLKLQKSQPKLELSGSVTFEGGMQTLINRLAEVLKHDIKLNSKEHFKLKGNTIICTDSFNAAELLKELRPTLSSELRRIQYRPLSSSTVFLKREIKSLNKAFGVLIPLENGFNSIGVVNNKAIFPINNQNISSYTLMSPKNLTDEEVLQDLLLLSSDVTKEDIQHIETTFWDKALPVYDLQLYLSVKKLHQLASNEDHLAIFGNYVAGISLREMITAAKTFSRHPLDYTEAN